MKKFYIPPIRLAIINLVVLTATGIIFLRQELKLDDYIMIEVGVVLTVIFIVTLISTKRIKQSKMEPELVDMVVMDGPYSVVRHPYYAGIICLNIAFIFFFRTPWLIIPAIVFIVLWYKEARYEESVLISKFELMYLSYMETKGMFFPRFRRPGT